MRHLANALILLVLAIPAAVQAGDAEQVVARVLDSLHHAASEADGERYWALFAEDAIFFGTDPEERWTIDEFRAYADPYFDQRRGWTYTVVERHIYLAPGGGVAWFDEELDNDKYGGCRGTGVLVLLDGLWKISQYNLSIPIPNDLALSIVEMIRQFEN